MPLRNRVTPWGEIVAVPARGTLMGNRGGCLHDDERRLGRVRWRSAAWICCLLEFKERRRQVMRPGHYTELFFLDEATALAAGHRPCAECRRAEFEAFRRAWATAHGGVPPRAPEMDRILHGERVGEGGAKRRHLLPGEGRDVLELPDGVMVEIGGAAWRVGAEGLRRWSADGYGPPLPRPDGPVFMLTPPAIAAVLAAGYRPRS
ncbi:MAG TPA: hypothetical protein VED40_04680 [Azospirillaceae bacterium]|nr:hypothetical protein [Azospirillaceae bacterium]